VKKRAIENDFHPDLSEHRNAYEKNFFKFNPASRRCKAIGLLYQILRPSLAEKCLKKITISFLNICFYLKILHFTAQRRSERKMYAS
jgi:hypothetical protein